MKCPYCGNEMIKGVTYIDDLGSTAVVFQSDEDYAKKGLFKKIDPVVFVKYKRDKEESYRCKECKKVIVVLNEQ